MKFCPKIFRKGSKAAFKQKDNIKMDIREMVYEYVNWFSVPS
jgi:hypothetical protein